ncbi:hypothetical protein B0H11DRAFT_2284258 [Mycena galericulata]|nr:hypothetical protein B0H11DRAFT_2284258 [Mycena galericulata]
MQRCPQLARTWRNIRPQFDPDFASFLGPPHHRLLDINEPPEAHSYTRFCSRCGSQDPSLVDVDPYFSVPIPMPPHQFTRHELHNSPDTHPHLLNRAKSIVEALIEVGIYQGMPDEPPSIHIRSAILDYITAPALVQVAILLGLLSILKPLPSNLAPEARSAMARIYAVFSSTAGIEQRSTIHDTSKCWNPAGNGRIAAPAAGAFLIEDDPRPDIERPTRLNSRRRGGLDLLVLYGFEELKVMQGWAYQATFR